MKIILSCRPNLTHVIQWSIEARTALRSSMRFVSGAGSPLGRGGGAITVPCDTLLAPALCAIPKAPFSPWRGLEG